MGAGKCYNFKNLAHGYKFDQRNPQGVPGQCIATMYQNLNCQQSQRNSLGACGRCNNAYTYDLAGETIQKWRSVRVKCGISQCSQDSFPCGTSKCGITRRDIESGLNVTNPDLQVTDEAEIIDLGDLYEEYIGEERSVPEEFWG